MYLAATLFLLIQTAGTCLLLCAEFRRHIIFLHICGVNAFAWDVAYVLFPKGQTLLYKMIALSNPCQTCVSFTDTRTFAEQLHQSKEINVSGYYKDQRNNMS